MPSIDEVLGASGGEPCLLILDDLFMFEDLSGVTEFSSMHCHHNKVTAIYCVQNCYEQHKGIRMTTLNRNLTGRMIFFQQNDMRMLQIINSSLYPERKNYLYNCILAAKREGRNYVYVNTHCFSTVPRRYNIYTHLFPFEQGTDKSPKFFDLEGH